MAKRKTKSTRKVVPAQVRIVGGEFRGRRLQHPEQVVVRPMKDRTREAVFNLIGPTVRGSHVWDLFSGTGAMALEALSRGAASATLVERHAAAARAIGDNIETLGVGDRAAMIRADVFVWGCRFFGARTSVLAAHGDGPWLVFCCPPYVFYQDRWSDLESLLHLIFQVAPANSQFVIEAEAPFDFERFWPTAWKTRVYSPAAVGICMVDS